MGVLGRVRDHTGTIAFADHVLEWSKHPSEPPPLCVHSPERVDDESHQEEDLLHCRPPGSRHLDRYITTLVHQVQ
jgi:hypothetical protein